LDIIESNLAKLELHNQGIRHESVQQGLETPFILFAGVEREVASKALSFGANCCINDGSAELVYDELSSAIRAATKTKKP